MEGKRLIVRGFVGADDKDLSVRGGVNPQTYRKIARYIGIVWDFLSSYGEDFYKGYKKGVEGKPLFATK